MRISRASRFVFQTRWLVGWLLVGWVGGLTSAYAHYPEYRAQPFDWLFIGWARGGIPVCLILLAIQIAWRVVRQELWRLIVGLVMGGSAYVFFVAMGTWMLPYWWSESTVNLFTGMLAGSLPALALWHAESLRGYIPQLASPAEG
jgi:hypothetical protein